jgi:putative transposase
MGISEATHFRWKQKYGGLGPSELRRLRQLEEENLKLKRLVADLSLEKSMLQDMLAKKSLRPARRRDVIQWLKDRYRVSERRGCQAMRFDRSTHRHQPIRDEQVPLRKRMREIALVRVRYGYRRIHVLLRREGWSVNHKRVQRLYREEGFNLRNKRPRRHVTAARRLERQRPTSANEIWAMDFVSDALFDGKRFRALTWLMPTRGSAWRLRLTRA